LRPGQPEKDSAEEKGQATLLSGHVVIVGYGLNGENLARALSATRIPYCVIEFNRRLARRAIESGGSVVVGDATRPHILEHAGVARARALVVCIDDRQATRRIVAQARRLRTEMFILARTRYVAEVDALYRLGADRVIPEEFETSVEVFSHVLREFGVPDNVIGRQIDHVRAGGYAMLRGIAGYIPARAEWSKVLGEAATRTLLIEPGSPAIGRSIKEIDFRARTGATILAVVRDGQALANPSAEMQLAEQDVLVLVGSSESLKLAESELTGSRQHGA
jgi:CPA2 family monovalent cation:H+ antiporter-2